MARKKKPSCETEQETFPTRLREIMAEQGINRKQLALGIGVRPQTVSLYTTGQSSPDVKTLNKICDYLNVSADFLLGASTAKSRTSGMGPACTFTGLSEQALSTILKLKNYKTIGALDGLLRNANAIFLFAKIRWLALLKVDEVKKFVTTVRNLQDEQIIIAGIEEYEKYKNEIDFSRFRISTDFLSMCDTVSDDLASSPKENFNQEEITQAMLKFKS